ncbi:uncharacterized protein BJ171DRAFT_514791 [Polychytrium aggregatum]|uniref:uncharacterized protein n=1 Tax=Polychytrium aggregatum TaxID=110093 RepID=UPI0022FE7212|nr:uncharacterized protein BJ171DRAFT_514791 [Polychytrium aggregatum]KAI9202371.1 hypothetical protein BJ171DRAFT_514791 [Polychytrium aggregatum]
MNPLLRSVARASYTSAWLFLAGDVASQLLFPEVKPTSVPALGLREEPKVAPNSAASAISTPGLPAGLASSLESFDSARALKFASIGAFLHGPFYHEVFRFLDARFGAAKTASVIVTKTAVNQLCFSPLFMAMVLAYSAALEGDSPLERVRSQFVDVYTNFLYVWPVSNLVTFRFIPPAHRILFVNFVGFGWNIYLSWVTAAAAAATHAALDHGPSVVDMHSAE